MLLLTLSQIVGYLISVIVLVVIVQFVLGLLLSFNVLSRQNDVVVAIYNATNALLEPLLAPVRKIMPNTGAIDFSPLVLIVGLNVLNIVLRNAAQALA